MSSAQPSAYPQTTAGAYVAPPPPMGYPTMDGGAHNQAVAVMTKSKGDGFLKGCCAALCCCCMLDACF